MRDRHGKRPVQGGPMQRAVFVLQQVGDAGVARSGGPGPGVWRVVRMDADYVLRTVNRASVALAAVTSFSVTPPALCVDQVTVTFV